MGVRARLAITLVALVGLTAAVLGVGSYLFVDATLRAQARDDAAAQARFDLSVLVPARLPEPPAETTADDLGESRLLETFRLRGVETIVDLGGGEPFVSRADLIGALDELPADHRARVDAGELAYAWTSIAGRPVLVVGGRPAGGGPAFHFIHDAAAIEATLEQLRLALGVGSAILILLALVAAQAIARRVLRPVRAAASAAERIEHGDLSARVPVTSRDEFGAWAERFNRMAATLDETFGRLEASQAQNRRFVADVSHELRTPLAALVAEASLLRPHLGALPPDARRAGELLVEDVARLRQLVDELMELSRFDAAVERSATEAVDLAALVRRVVAARGAPVDLAIASEPLVVSTDPRRVERILGNLLDNAAEHAAGAGVEVALSAVGGGGAVVEVLDRGPGVQAERLPHLFERFYKADPSRRGGSSGLGLAIAAEHAALLGGSLAAANRAGGGLVVALRLPAAAPSMAGAATEPLPDGDPGVIRRIETGPIDPTRPETLR